MAITPKKVTNSTTPQGASSGVSADTKTIVTVLLLLFVYPVGLILMWVWTNWPKWVKFLLTLPVVLFILGMIAVFATVFIFIASGGAKVSENQLRQMQQYEEQQEMLKTNEQGSTEAGTSENSDAVEWEMSY